MNAPVTPSQLARTAYAVVATLLAGWLLMQALPGVIGAQGGPPWDATDHYAAREFQVRHDPYGPTNNIARPPTSAFWFLPLAQIPYGNIKPYISAVMVLLLLLQLIVVAGELRLPLSLLTATLAFCAILDTWWLQYHLGVGQTSILIAFAYTLGWLFLRRRQELAGGAMLGLAATMKPFAALMLLMLVVGRRWRTLVAAAAAWLAVAVYMTQGFGLHSWVGFLQSKRAFADQWIWNENNGSLPTLVLHLFRPICRGHSAALPIATAIATALSLLLVVGASLLSRRSLRAGRIDLPFALFAVLSVFCNPVVWEHYNVFLLLPVGVAAVGVWRAWRSGLRWWWALPLALALLALLALLSVDTRNALAAASNDPRLHVRMHLWEVSDWIRWPLAMAVLASLIRWFERRDGVTDGV